MKGPTESPLIHSSLSPRIYEINQRRSSVPDPPRFRGITPSTSSFFQQALPNHRSGSLVVTPSAKFNHIVGILQKMLLTCANRMISADYVMPLGIPSLLTNFASPTLSDSTHFIPSESTDQSTWPDYHHLLPFLSYCQALAFMPSARHLFRIRRHCSWLFFPLSFFTKGMIEGPPFRPYTSRSLLCVESEWLGGRSL